jgi:predicted NUDIX family phosphoesterase
MQKQDIKSVYRKKEDEKIVVVSRQKLFQEASFNGIQKINFEQYQNIIETHKEFRWRSEMEIDENYKQIIPYLVFSHNNKFFIMERKSTSSEARLQSKLSIGIGGHIREDDLQKATIVDWAEREFHEEVEYNGKLKIEPIGLLNDDSNAVGRVHVGFVFLLNGDSAEISIRDEHKAGSLKTPAECKQLYNRMENWSKMVLDFLL